MIRPAYGVSVLFLASTTWMLAAEPTDAQRQAIAAAEKVGADAEIDESLEKDACIAVKFRRPGDDSVAVLGRFPAVGAVTIVSADLCTPKAWEGLTRLPKLQKLVLGKSTAADQSAALIAKMKSLQVLYLGEARITDVGVGRLASLTELRELDLYDTSVTDTGVAHLAKLEKLEQLNLSGTRITDRGMQSLAAVKTLKLLRVNNTRVSEKAITAIEKALPELIVRY